MWLDFYNDYNIFKIQSVKASKSLLKTLTRSLKKQLSLYPFYQLILSDAYYISQFLFKFRYCQQSFGNSLYPAPT